MAQWVDSWVEGCLDGRTAEQTDGWMVGCVDGWGAGRMAGGTPDGQMAGWKANWTQNHVTVKIRVIDARLPGFKSHPCHLLVC